MKNVSDIVAGGPALALVLAVVVAAGAGAFACRKAPPSTHSEGDDSPMRCAGCHTPEFTATTKPMHVGARPKACGACHTQTSWGHWRVAHPWWELTGAHAKAAEDEAVVGKENQVKCFWCHRGEASTWKGTKKECVSCHADDRAMSKFPGHDVFPATCEDCHSTVGWKPTNKPFDLPLSALPVAIAIADAGSADAALDAARPKPVYVPHPIPTVRVPPTTTGSTPPIPTIPPTTPTTTATTPPTTPTTPPTTPPIPTTPPTVPEVITRPSRHK